MKRKMKIKTLLVAAGFACAAISCENITDLNVNPSFPTEVSPISLIAPIQQQMARGIQFDSRYLGSYTQYHSNATAGNAWDRLGYVQNSDASGEIWRMTYFAMGLNITRLQEGAIESQRYDILGASKAMRAWSWQITTDYHGDLLKFDQVFTQRLNYDYDNQETAYAEVQKVCTDALADLARTDGGVNASYMAQGDKVYLGDRSKWIKFVNGILARNANSISNKSTYNPDKVIGFVDKAMASSADDFVIKFNGNITDDANFFGPLRNNWAGFRQTDFIVRAMNGSIFTGAIDPRMSRVLAPSVGASETAPASAANPDPTKYTYNGNPLNTAAATAGTSRIPNLWGTYSAGLSTDVGRYLFRNNVDFPIMTYVEMQFIKAEAQFRKGDKAAALITYKNAISNSIDFVNKYTVARTTFPITTAISAAEKAAFLANVDVVPTDNTKLTLSMIMMQKYVALYGFGYLETWTDMRKARYGTDIYPTLNTVPNPAQGGLFLDNNGKLPYRVRPRYNSEYVWNFGALQAIGGDKIDYHTVEMWFMQP
jgi:hypothetical protein